MRWKSQQLLSILLGKNCIKLYRMHGCLIRMLKMFSPRFRPTDSIAQRIQLNKVAQAKPYPPRILCCLDSSFISYWLGLVTC